MTIETTIAPPQEHEGVQSSGARLVGFSVAFFVTFVSIFVPVWIWAIFGRLWFLDPEYPMWTGKRIMIEKCAVGTTVIVGDSRAMAGLRPDILGDDVTNLALGGGTAIEASFIIDRLSKCPAQPRRVILSLSSPHFIKADVVWQRSAPFGFLSFYDLEDLRHVSRLLHDAVIYPRLGGMATLENWLTNWSYRISLPAYYFGAMLNAGFVLRHERNVETLEAIIDKRGHHYFGAAERDVWPVGEEANLESFAPSPLLIHYFDSMLKRLAAAGVDVIIASMPITAQTAAEVHQSYKFAVAAFMQSYETKYSNVRIVGEFFPSLPNVYFGDAEHLNAKGAALWSEQLLNSIGK